MCTWPHVDEIKKCRQLGIPDIVMGRVSWVTRVMGQLTDGSQESWVTKLWPINCQHCRNLRVACQKRRRRRRRSENGAVWIHFLLPELLQWWGNSSSCRRSRSCFDWCDLQTNRHSMQLEWYHDCNVVLSPWDNYAVQCIRGQQQLETEDRHADSRRGRKTDEEGRTTFLCSYCTKECRRNEWMNARNIQGTTDRPAPSPPQSAISGR